MARLTDWMSGGDKPWGKDYCDIDLVEGRIMSVKASEITIVHNAAHQRFEMRMDNDVAFVSYTSNRGCVDFDHTYVPGRFRGKGVAAALARAALNEARERHWKIIPGCSYIAAFIERHPEFADLVAR